MEERPAGEFGQLLTNGLLVGFAPASDLNCRHDQLPSLRASISGPPSGLVTYRYILGPTGTACQL
jgi:hypothetical protein